MINLNHVEAFVAVVETGTTAQAAEVLHTVQQSISRQIKELENELGYPLFTRSGKRLQLTTFGFHAFRRAKDLIQSAKEFEMLGTYLESAKKISVGASLDLLAYFVPQVIIEYKKLYNFDISIYPGLSNEVTKMVNEGSVDVGLISADLEPLPNVITSRLFEDPLSILYSKSHFNLDVIRDPLIIFSKPIILMTNNTLLRCDIDEMFAKLNIKPDIRLEADDVEVIKQLTKSGLGITILPHSVCMSFNNSEVSQIPMNEIFDGDEMKKLTRIIKLVTPKEQVNKLTENWIQLCKTQALKLNP